MRATRRASGTGRGAALLAAHLLADGPLQPARLSLAKRGFAGPGGPTRAQAMLLHAAVHGAGVALVTRSPALGLAEAAAHAGVDELRCRGRLTLVQDQAIHLACQLLWAVLAGQAERARRRAQST